MANPPLRRELAELTIKTIEKCMREGFRYGGAPSAKEEAARRMKIPAPTISSRIRAAKVTYGLEVDRSITAAEPPLEVPGAIRDEPSPFAIPHKSVHPSYVGGAVIEIVSRPDNTFLFGAAGDLHAASKYARWDVREDLYQLFQDEGAQCNFDTGNWIDGESRFNVYDLETNGLDAQVSLLARRHPKNIKTFAVWGDDHEGWYVQREGIDVGRYAESIMRAEGHDWTNLGFMEAHVVLRNANSGATTNLAVVHPGGGSAYALSYSVQKIIESLEGGEKPGAALYGHYHKLWAGLIRNVWCVQTGTQQDQTPFMRKKRLEAHVGGTLVKLRQDPRTGALISMTPEIIRYYNKGFHAGTGRWSRHGPVIQVERT